jgi:putative transcriptional regulator
MIVFKLRERLNERSMLQATLSRILKIRKNTINAYYHGYAKRIRIEDLDKMCAYLDCSLIDIVEYIPDKK